MRRIAAWLLPGLSIGMMAMVLAAGPLEGADVVDRAGESAAWPPGNARLVFWPERSGVGHGETVEFGVMVSGLGTNHDGQRLTSNWRVTGGTRTLRLGEPAATTIAGGAASDLRRGRVEGWGSGDYWLECEVHLPGVTNVTLRRALIVLEDEPRTTLPIYACFPASNPDKPHLKGADVFAEARFNTMFTNGIDGWDETGRVGDALLDLFACHNLDWIEFGVIECTIMRSPIRRNAFDSYHDPDVRAFARQVSQAVAQWGRRNARFRGLSLMDGPAARSYAGNNAEVFREKFLDYDPVKEPLRSAINEALTALSGRTELRVDKASNALRHFKPGGEQADNSDRPCEPACLAAFRALMMANYEVELLGEEDMTVEGLKGKKVIVAPHLAYLDGRSRQALEVFRARGDMIVTDQAARLKTDGWLTLPVRFLEADKNPEQFAQAQAALVEAIGEVAQPRVRGLATGMVYGLHDGGDARYLVVSNIQPALTNFEGRITAVGVPTGFGTVVDGDAVERVGRSFWIPQHPSPQPSPPRGEGVQFDLELAAGDFAVLAFLPTGVAKVQLEYPERIRRGEAGEYTVTLRDSAGRIIRAVVPLEITIQEGQDPAARILYRATKPDGTFRGKFLAPLARSGNVSIEVKELLAGHAVTRTIAVAGQPPQVATARLPETIVSDRQALRQFASRSKRVVLVIPAGEDELAERLQAACGLHFAGLDVRTADAVRRVEELPASVAPGDAPGIQVVPHWKPTQLEVGQDAILVGTEESDALIKDLVGVHLLPRRLDHPLYQGVALVQHVWAPFDPDRNVIVIRVCLVSRTRRCIIARVGGHVTVLGSGSAGNCTLIESATTRILIDAGLSGRQINERLAALGRSIDQVDGILLTHEHCDHTRGLARVCKQKHVPVFANRLTAEAVTGETLVGPKPAISWRLFATGASFEIGDLHVDTFSVPHDAYDPVGFVIRHATWSVGVLTDLGHPTKLAIERVRDTDVLVVEANHDVKMLQNDTARPWATKQRIMSRHGHLSNDAAAELTGDALGDRMRHVFLAHLSRDCNRPELAEEVVFARLQKLGARSVQVHVASQDKPTATVAVGGELTS